MPYKWEAYFVHHYKGGNTTLLLGHRDSQLGIFTVYGFELKVP